LDNSTKVAGFEKLMPVERIRKEGGGRKGLKEQDSNLLKTVDFMVEPISRGHPEGVLKCTCLSTRTLADALTKKGHILPYQSRGPLKRSWL